MMLNTLAASPVLAARRTASSTEYADALTALVMALLARYFLTPWLGVTLPFVTMYAAIAVGAWRAGWQGGLLVVFCSYFFTGMLLSAPDDGRLTFAILGGWIGLAGYLFTSLLVIALARCAVAARTRERHGRELLDVLMHAVTDAVIVTDTSLRVTALNAKAESLTGWTEAAALQQPIDKVFQIVDAARRNPIASPVATALREDAIAGLLQPTVLIGKSGSQYDIEHSAMLVRGSRDEAVACVLVFRDVSGQRQAACALDAQIDGARKLASILESSNDAIVCTSLDGVIHTWNPAAESLFGYEPIEAIGHNISMLTPHDRPGEAQAIINRIASGERVDRFVTERISSEFERIKTGMTIVPIRDTSGKVTGALTIARELQSV